MLRRNSTDMSLRYVVACLARRGGGYVGNPVDCSAGGL
jgi:hypothetical protein